MWEHKLIWFTLVIIVVTGCTTSNTTNTLFFYAQNTSEVVEMIEDSLTFGQVTASEVTTYVQDNNLNCIEQEDVSYSTDFSEQEYDSWIVCWVSAPNADSPSTGNIISDNINEAVSSWVFRIVFLFNEDTLVDVKVFLDDHNP